MNLIETFRVHVPGYGSILLPAMSEEQACISAASRFSEAMGGLVPQGLMDREVRAEVADLPPSAGYDYVSRCYGLDLEAGQRVRVCIEGSDDDREGWVVYPGRGTAYAHVWFDDMDHPSRIHPLEIELLPAPGLQP